MLTKTHPVTLTLSQHTFAAHHRNRFQLAPDAFDDEDLLVEFGSVSSPQQAAELQSRLEERRTAAAAATTSGSSSRGLSSKSSSGKKGFVPRKLRKAQLPIEALPKVAIVGRPNVGKSALFNRLAGSSLAVVYDYPGVTRDRLYTRAFWGDKEYCLIDTGEHGCAGCLAAAAAAALAFVATSTAVAAVAAACSDMLFGVIMSTASSTQVVRAAQVARRQQQWQQQD